VWNYHSFGDLTATASKIEFLGWTRKPVSDWWAHPIFTLNGVKEFWPELMASFWRGEFVWHGKRLGWQAIDAFYWVSSTLAIGLAVISLFPRSTKLTDFQRQVLWLAFTSFAALVLLVALLSMAFDFGRDTFAFRNEIRARHPDTPDLYANYCFVLARAMRQFFLFARFDPSQPKLDPAEYVERIRLVVSDAPWHGARPPDDRVVIPGYASLREFSAAQEEAVKRGLGGRFWTLVHPTNWRVTLPVTSGHQETVASEIVADLDQGRLVQLLVTNWRTPELNHTVVAFGYRWTDTALELTVWDPNDPTEPGLITFERPARQFVATRVYDTRPGAIRVFRMYYSWLL